MRVRAQRSGIGPAEDVRPRIEGCRTPSGLRSPARRRAGFTLIEMVVMIMIIAILSSVAVPAYHRFRARTQFEATVQKTVSLLAWARAAAIESNADAVVRYDHT